MTCVVLLAEGFEETEAIVPADILRRAGVDVRLAGVSNGSLLIPGAHGIKVMADVSCAELAGEVKNGMLPDAVFCPGGMPGSTNLAQNADVSFVLKEAQRHKRIIAAICAAPAVVLAPLGLLDGKTFTCYPGMENLAKYAPAAKPEGFAAEKVVRSGTLVTSRGPATASDLGFALAAMLTDEKTAAEVQKGMLFA